MDLGSVPPQLIIGAGGNLVYAALTKVAGRVRRSIEGTPRQEALQRAYQAAVEAFIAALPDAATGYIDAIELFFSDKEVQGEFAGLVSTTVDAAVDVEFLRSRFDEIGGDLSTMPELSFEGAVIAFEDTFRRVAAEDPELRDILSFQIVQRTEAQMTALAEKQESGLHPK